MAEILCIEEESFEFPWADTDFTRCLRQRNCIGMVAEISGGVVGYMLYELHRTKVHVLNFAVARTHRRLGIGTACLLYTSPSPRDLSTSRMPSSA